MVDWRLIGGLAVGWRLENDWPRMGELEGRIYEPSLELDIFFPALIYFYRSRKISYFSLRENARLTIL